MVSKTSSSSSSSSSSPPKNVTVNDLMKELPQPIKFGYLKKLGGSGISKNWRKRFFILTESGILYYFKHRTSNEPVGCVDLSQYTKVFKDPSKKNLFYILNENDQHTRVFHLISENATDQEQWTKEINAFFEGDISDLKNHLMDVQKKKQFNTLTKNEMKNSCNDYASTASSLSDNGTDGGTQGSESSSDSFLDNYQLVFRGHRISLVSNSFIGSGNGNGSGSGVLSTSTSSSTTTTSLSNSPPPTSRFNNMYLGNNNNETTTSTTSTTTSPQLQSNVKVTLQQIDYNQHPSSSSSQHFVDVVIDDDDDDDDEDD
ncbi:hypothetical protein DFA_03246 [Cavenderia fasciculata]|uniref:PH domain-containing protein n=1 Tax=Cavenderia fasciculata TaxID=261658 RepID=F4PH16_CACFS|nr:uncharacterized protein DFA_03246 [Cavenderia fasciculata]EGG25000.1 hypothetical protein DFA_03246 [Cavenderia fasciculata]|eukprot:XP_004362851.1 hypothetical protein DFA_03246 [Cavenderia fasciculata]